MKKIKDKNIILTLKQRITDCKTKENLSEINHIKKMRGYDTFYRIRLGDYRIGIEVIENTIIFTRFLHRKDIYKFFP